ncbi:FAD-dependent monooxygenase [Acinetobacter sp. ME22]|uniref:FAD-dependent oxidoreductase n=1 Tax=Acinetobacter sp. ME22 TaxID=2904802 RepID=UPI001EDB61F3|nr:NAD(P)/FAD-dependent oxidoreductase [Acinetobacter sp. ME22]MCG2573885.1 FAD-dependent monooxygenase [Acinetobacter sp. ME22]
MKTLHFAIIGAGTAGLATAALLARQGFQVSIFEKAQHLDPVGAGLLLQPAGLAVFEHLGVLEHACQLGAKVTGLEGQLADGRLLVDSHYHEAGNHYTGLGIHRATLCHVLQTAVNQHRDAITWYMGYDIQQLQESPEQVRLIGQDAQQHPFDAAFDAVIVANGARSQLRPSAWVKIDQPYPWGAAWTIVPECQQFDREILHQFYDTSQIMMGILPTGAIPTAPEQRLSSVFWSLPSSQLPDFLQQEQQRELWLKQVSKRWSKAADWLEQVTQTSSTTWLSAQYRDVVMSQYGQGRIGVIGDAAHAMSPQLGQGANMALLDAWALSQSVQHSYAQQQLDWAKLWQHYHQVRRSSTFFYQSLSRLLTPLYQSDLRWASRMRDVLFPLMYRIPYFRRQMAITISGLKTNALQQLDYTEIAQSNVTSTFQTEKCSG